MSENDNTKGEAPEAGAPEDAKTVFAPSPFTSPPPQRPASAPQAEVPQATSLPPSSTSFSTMAPRTDGASIQIGDVLNHMFEVKRFIARGGMGEVFEGVNVASDERVAIKVMLPQLAADPNVQAMFRKEAKTLTKLAHPALVQYRVMATEPQLGVLYIVTEYIDSTNLEDALPGIKASADELLALTRRLAEGLSVAHGLGAIHRDISPDNVLLEDGDLAKARIIDFGIAKDLDPNTKTIVGDGFAGKLNFVAPEQLGDFNREVGPWTDVYSLALVVLAVARGKPFNMGGTLVDAVDKRRQGPDISDAPAELQPLLSGMLKPNPVDRLRSMDEVIAFIDGRAQGPTAPSAKPAPPKDKPAKSAPDFSAVALPKLDPKLLMMGGGGVGVLLVVILAFVIMSGKPKSGADAPSGSVAGVAASPVDLARQAMATALPTVPCAWLDLTDVQAKNGGVDVSLKGVAADTIAVQKAIGEAMTAKGLTLNALNTDDVAPLDQGKACDLLGAYAGIRATGGSQLSAVQIKTEMDIQADAPPEYKNVKLARPVITFYVEAQTPEIAVYGLETSGAIMRLQISKAQLADAEFLSLFGIHNMGDGRYRLIPNQDKPGWGGLLLLKGDGPFPDNVIMPPPAQRGAAWQQAFQTMAAQKGWRSEMLWIKAVDETPN